MPKLTFKYKVKESGILGRTRRPLIDLEIYSIKERKWIIIYEILADTGADISILPEAIGKAIVKNISAGRILKIRGVVPSSFTEVYVHQLKFRLNNKVFTLPVAISQSNDVPPILGREGGLDLFKALFNQGKEIILE